MSTTMMEGQAGSGSLRTTAPSYGNQRDPTARTTPCRRHPTIAQPATVVPTGSTLCTVHTMNCFRSGGRGASAGLLWSPPAVAGSSRGIRVEPKPKAKSQERMHLSHPADRPLGRVTDSAKLGMTSGSRWAATDCRRDQHDHWRTVTDRRMARALICALTCGFPTILPNL
jgi:hypothetical protein